MVSLEQLSRKLKKLLHVGSTNPRTPRILPNEDGALGSKNLEKGKQYYIPENFQHEKSLPNQARLARCTASQNANAEVCSKERAYSQGNQTRKLENKLQIHLREGKRLRVFTGQLIKKQDCLRRGERGESDWKRGGN